MDWTSYLQSGETLLWEGRPAPRCYTFRNWRHSLFGSVLLVIALWWQIIGLGLVDEYGLWVACVPIPVVLLGLYLFVGHLLVARWRWNRIYYGMTDQHLMILDKNLHRMLRREMTWLRADYAGTHLATISVASSDGQIVRLYCIEHPETLIPLIEATIPPVPQADEVALSKGIDLSPHP